MRGIKNGAQGALQIRCVCYNVHSGGADTRALGDFRVAVRIAYRTDRVYVALRCPAAAYIAFG